MYVLYYKAPKPVYESVRRIVAFMSWEWKQLAMCEEEKPLRDYIDKQPDKRNYYIEKQGY